MSKDLKHEKDAGKVKAKMSYLANNYVNTYKPSKNTLRKHKIIKKLTNNQTEAMGLLWLIEPYICQVYIRLLMIRQNV